MSIRGVMAAFAGTTASPSFTRGAAHSGQCFAMGSSSVNLPSSYSVSAASAMTGFVMLMSRKIASSSMARPFSMSAIPAGGNGAPVETPMPFHFAAAPIPATSSLVTAPSLFVSR